MAEIVGWKVGHDDDVGGREEGGQEAGKVWCKVTLPEPTKIESS